MEEKRDSLVFHKERWKIECVIVVLGWVYKLH